MLSENLNQINERIASAASRSSRSIEEILLLAVSKTFPAEIVREAVEAGLDTFGENKVQEAIAKIPELPSHLQWHLIGPLQKNKIRKALPCFDLIHSVDSLATAQQIDRIAAEEGLHPRVLLQINVAADAAKHGFSKVAIHEQFEMLLELERLQIEGVMTIPAFDPDPEKTRPAFASLRETRDELVEKFNCPLTEISMGMSHDFDVAIEEGATIIRVGSALFGKRKSTIR
ncbi:UNVERIFIED_CONTAM: hypothetical protein GTU68_046121 [Idotea baltica]|nr:hypothetical protein [Idotea baltica]